MFLKYFLLLKKIGWFKQGFNQVGGGNAVTKHNGDSVLTWKMEIHFIVKIFKQIYIPRAVYDTYVTTFIITIMWKPST